MKAYVNEKQIKCPICECEHFEVSKDVNIPEITNYFEKDELDCKQCGYVLFFENPRDVNKNYTEKKIIYRKE